ncbi:signal peptidase I [Chloroflexota bacterium]
MTSVVETDSINTPLPPSNLPAEDTTQPVPIPTIEELSVTIPRPKVRTRTFLNDVVETLIMVVAIYTLVNLIAPRYIVEGSSMQPNFATGEWIIVTRLPYLVGEPARGDVVVLDFPEPQEDLIKRVVGLPGETVAVHDNLVYVNGVPLNEPYINEQPRYNKEEVYLGPDEFFVLGDNRNNSRDSHSFGAVTRDKVIGRALIIYWPPPNWSFVPSQSYNQPAPPPLPSATPPPTATPAPTMTVVVPSP